MSLRPGAGLAAVLVFNPALGALYTFSVFIAPLEASLSAPRADISAIFAMAVATFTVGMFAAPYVYRFAAIQVHLLACSALSVSGLVLSANAGALWQLILGYGVFFGLGGGYAYSITLQLITLALPHRRGLATGLGVGSFAVGSILLTILFARTVVSFGPSATFAGMAAMMAGVALLSALLAKTSGLVLPDARTFSPPVDGGSFRRVFPLLWFGFFFGAFAGVMSIGHAAGIVANHGGGAALAVIGTVVINIGNAGGRIVAGTLADLIPPPRVAGLAHFAAILGFLLILLFPGPSVAVVALGLEGLAYGLASGGYPAAIGIYFGIERYGRYLGFLITAWGAAGLIGPWLAGWLYDLSGAYVLSATIGLGMAVVGLIVSFRIPPPLRTA